MIDSYRFNDDKILKIVSHRWQIHQKGYNNDLPAIVTFSNEWDCDCYRFRRYEKKEGGICTHIVEAQKDLEKRSTSS